jgi:predicted nucleic acid-binding protein
MVVDAAVVCDASVLASLTFDDPNSREAGALIARRRLLAPTLLRYEMAHVALRRSALAGSDGGIVMQAFFASLRVPVRLIEPSWPAVVELARVHGLSAYDAAYLQLSLALRVPLATLDERLGAAAEAVGVRAYA